MGRTGSGTWEADAVLRDGRTVHLRSIRPDDAGLVQQFHERQSPESIYFRFFSPRPRLSERELRHFTTVDGHDRVAFVALLHGQLIGVARYERYTGTDTAEVAFFVDDGHHGRGLATLLLEYLAAAARENGIGRFRASTLPANRKMLGVFAAAGYEIATHIEDGVVDVAFDLRATGEVVAALQRRERLAEAASVRRMVQPARVAVIDLDLDRGDDGDDGDPDDPGERPGDAGARTLGAVVARRISNAGFTGVLQHLDRTRLGELEEGTDMVVLAGPDDRVVDALDACGRRAVGAAIVMTSARPGLVDAMVDAARRHGMRLLGPGSPGVSNTDVEVRLHAMASAPLPAAGQIAMLTESGDAMTAIVEHAGRVGLGLSTLVTLDEPTDLNAADLLSYWAEDPSSRAVLMYLGPSPLPARFVPAARSASMSKPVVALHAASAPSGGRRDRVRRCDDAMIRQSGVIPVESLQEMFAIGRLLVDQPAPSGRGAAVIGTSEGAVGLAAAACAAAGLDPVVRFTSIGGLGESFAAAASDPALHAVVVVDATPGPHPPSELSSELLSASARRPDLTFVASTIGGERPVRLVDPTTGAGVPVFTFPEHAANAIARLAAAGEWRSTARVYGEETSGSPDVDHVRALVGRWSAADGEDGGPVGLDHLRQEELLGAFGIRVVPRRTVCSAGEAVAAAEDLGWPVVLKAGRRDRRKRSVLSGVALDLAAEEDLRSTWMRMGSALGDDAMAPAVVQRLVEQGTDVRIRALRTDGVTTVEIGLGGPAAAFDPWELGVVPLTLADAGVLVASSSVGRALTDPIDRVPVTSLLHRVAVMMESVEGIRSLHADPVIVSGPDAWITDLDVTIGVPDGVPPVRHLG